MASTNRRDRDERKKKIASARKMAEASAGRSSKAFRLPQGVQRFVPKEGEYELDIVGYAAGKGNPAADEGYYVAGRLYHVHRNVGANKDSYLCPAATSSKRCPICEYRQEVLRRKSWDDPEVRQLNPSKRELWNVIDRKEPQKGVQVFDFSNWCFGKMLGEKVQRKGDKYEGYHDPDGGYTLEVAFGKEKIGKNEMLEAKDIEFKPRKGIDPELAKKAVCLDKCLVELPYDELKSIFESGVGSEEDAGDRNGRKDDDDSQDSGDVSVDAPDVDVGDMLEYKGRKYEVLSVNDDGKSVTAEDKDGKERKLYLEDCKLLEAEEEEPSGDDSSDDSSADESKAKTSRRKPKKDDEDEDEPNALDDDEEEDEEEDSEDDSAEEGSDDSVDSAEEPYWGGDEEEASGDESKDEPAPVKSKGKSGSSGKPRRK